MFDLKSNNQTRKACSRLNWIGLTVNEAGTGAKPRYAIEAAAWQMMPERHLILPMTLTLGELQPQTGFVR
jgi:hypothetical protein